MTNTKKDTTPTPTPWKDQQPTMKQIAFLASLCKKHSITFEKPANKREASDAISALLALPTPDKAEEVPAK